MAVRDPYLDEVQTSFRDSVEDFANKRVRGGYLKRASSSDFFHELYQELGKLGLFSLGVPSEHGGSEADRVTTGLVCYTLARHDVNVGYATMRAIFEAEVFAKSLSDRLREEWLGPIVRGEALTSLALTEAGAGSDASAIRARADRVDGGWVLNGEKTSISAATHSSAFMVLTQTYDGDASLGISMFFVPVQDGVTIASLSDPGLKPIGRGVVHLQDVFVPDDAVMGVVGRAFQTVLRELDYSRPLAALLCIGAAEMAIDMTVDYVRQREAFGRTIASFQGVSFPLAEHVTHLEAIKALAFRVLAMSDKGIEHTRESAMVKWWAPRACVEAIQDCIVLHGHTGYSEDYPLQQLLRDVAGFEIAEGPPQIQKMIIARELIGRESLPYQRERPGRRTTTPSDQSLGESP